VGSQSRGVAPPSGDQRQKVVVGGIPTDVGDRVFFALDSSVLSADAQRTLQRQAVWVRSAGPRVLTVEGHCDERGTREYNLALGDRRASVVRDYLVAQGVTADRLRVVSYGKERPQVAGHDEATWAQNRRAVSVSE
jgi:peptidoglycan-associated lipoprotein